MVADHDDLERYFALSLRIWYVVLDRVPGLGAAVFRLLEAMLAGDARRARELMRERVVEFEREIMAAFNRE